MVPVVSWVKKGHDGIFQLTAAAKFQTEEIIGAQNFNVIPKFPETGTEAKIARLSNLPPARLSLRHWCIGSMIDH